MMMSSTVVSPQIQIPFSAADPPLEEKSVNEDAQSVINFSSLLTSCDQYSLLSFEHKEEYYNNTNSDQISYHWHNTSHSPCRFSTDFNCFQTASISNSSKANQQSGGDGSYALLYSESIVTMEDSFDESGTQQTAGFNKRPHGGETTAQALKKQCTSNNKPKLHKSSPSKDPQSIAAKNRRERISERLKILQELVPNGSKVDLVTMLEKAISYVKFLQLQVKVLATDEFWPVQGGKAPDISQVREAIDAILSSSQRDRSCSSQ